MYLHWHWSYQLLHIEWDVTVSRPLSESYGWEKLENFLFFLIAVLVLEIIIGRKPPYFKGGYSGGTEDMNGFSFSIWRCVGERVRKRVRENDRQIY